ncbi:MAG: AAA family ATPase [Symploca sp. SIO2C1]|nr:AAA family ATPase [Symploca sp. SIO2C1]
MITLPGYQILSTISENENTLVYRGIKEQDEQPVILKVLKQDYPTPLQLSQYQQEYEITHNLNLAGVVKAYSLEKYQNTLVIIFEDFGGKSLRQCLNERLKAGKGVIPLEEFLRIAIQIADSLGSIHAANIIHKDLNPANILVNSETGQLKIIDFGMSTVLSQENTSVNNPNILEGTLAYISPEQTGRMNRSLDYRTDFYSLGVTFYELLTHRLPCEATDVLELVHFHIAKQPIPPGEGRRQKAEGRREEIPQVLSDIVMKLLAKNAEERYQSAWGLKADLEACLRQLVATGKVEPFSLGSQDISDKFQITQKLYGREQEIETLLAAFERVSGNFSHSSDTHNKQQTTNNKGQSELMLVVGYAGIGKSVLVQEIYKPITQKRGYFISGKFDQFQRNIPYFGMIKAFQELVEQLLTESERQLDLWREKLLVALGSNAQVIIDVIPEVELIIGKQPEVPDLSATESQNRFNLVFHNFIEVFTNSKHPLVIFLDDLQWADGASWKLIQLLMSGSETGLFLIGAYRDSEVGSAHPLRLTVEEIQTTGVSVNQIFLSPLNLTAVNQLIADTLKEAPEQTKQLAELVVRKTHGNPFFMKEFLKSLHKEGLLYFDINKFNWNWNLEQIQARGFTDNVVELMTSKIQKLSVKTQQVLKLAACICNQFELETLAIVNEKSPKETAALLWEAVTEGLIVPIGDVYKLIEIKRRQKAEGRGQKDSTPTPTQELTLTDGNFKPSLPIPPIEVLEKDSTRQREEGLFSSASCLLSSALQGESLVEYKFAHDRIQQAAYSLIPEEQRQTIHWQVGELLWQNTPDKQREQKIFDIVNQLNLGSELIKSQVKPDELAKLNLIAGNKAKASAAYEPALNYLKIGIGLLGQDGWKNEYDLTLELYVNAASTAYSCGDFKQMEELVQTVLYHGKNLLDKVKVYEVKIEAYTAQNHLLEAIKTALSVLELLEIKLPKKPNKLQILLGFIRTQFTLRGKRVEDLINLPQMRDPDKLAAMRIILMVGSAAYVAIPDLVPLIVFKQINLSLKYGNASESSYGYTGYGVTLCSVIGDINRGYQFGQLALSLLDKFNTKELKARIYLVVNDLIKHSKEHLRETLQPLKSAYSSGLETGDLEFAALSANAYCYHAYFVGKELSKLEQEMASYSDAISQLKQETALHFLQIWRQVVLNLMGDRDGELGKWGDEGAGEMGRWRDKETIPNSQFPIPNSQFPIPYRLIGKAYDEQKMLPLHQQVNDRTAILLVYFNKLVLCYLFAEYEEAVKNATITEKYLDGGLGTITVAVFHFYSSLALLAVFHRTRNSNQKRLLKKVVTNQKKLRKLAQAAPMNHWHKFYLVEAERCRVLGQDAKAIDYYERAMARAKENEYINEEALAHELAAKFYLAKGNTTIASAYMLNARYAYLIWGATAKVKNLEKNYPQLLATTSAAATINSQDTKTTNSTSDSNSGKALDLATVMKASQAISGEIVLDKLLAKLIELVMENAGAEKGVLILSQQGKLMIEATGEVHTNGVNVLQSLPLDKSEHLPTAIVNYVARTHLDVVLSDACSQGMFTAEPYISKNQSKSILCVPIINQGKLIGILYLENNLTTGAFTPQRVKLLKLLASQAAISLENALLYRTLEQKVQERTAQLKQKNELIRQVFGRYLTDEVVSNLLETPEGLALGGERREITILTSDLRGFTATSERLSPEEVVKILNIYLESMAEVITQYQGTIDEFMGDGILVLFGAPNAREDDAVRAVACALAMQLAMESVNQKMQEHGLPVLEMGIGINTGEVVVGNIGSEKRAKYGVVGSQVNLTFRIESYTTGGQIFISEQTFKEAQQLLKINQQKQVQPKGIDHPITIYDVGGIGGEYNLFLSQEEEILKPLLEKIPLQYKVVEDKQVGNTSFQGNLVQLSAKMALVSSEQIDGNELLKPSSNIKLNLLNQNSAAEFSEDIYAKVLEKTAQPGSFYISFTSQPPAVKARLEELYQWGIKN